MTEQSQSEPADRALAERAIATAEAKVNAELDAIPWVETIKSQAKTIERIERRCKASGKIVTAVRSYMDGEIQTKNLGSDEWFYSRQ